MELNVLLTFVKYWNKMVLWAAACLGLALSTHYSCPSDWLGLSDLLFQAGGDGKGHQMCGHIFKPPHSVGQRGLGAGRASPSKQVQASWWWSIIEETTMNSLTTVGSHSVCDVCEAVEQRQSVNTGCWEQKWCTAFTIKHRFKEKRLKKKTVVVKKNHEQAGILFCLHPTW